MSPSALLAPIAALYGAGVAARLAAYRRGLLRVERAARPVVSVGNVAAGGTGKTPFVRWLAGELLRRGRHPSILTRGYRRKSRGPLVVSDGRGTLAAVDAAGDEPSLLARALPGVPIVADARRARGAAIAEALPAAVDLHLLDDGFSHVALSRDVDVVLLDATAPDAGGALLPAGRLREPLSSLSRADLIVVTKTEQADPGPARELARRHAVGAPVFHAVTRVVGLLDDAGEAVPPRDLVERSTLAVAGLARPEAFAATLSGLGLVPSAFLAFPDHADYDAARLTRIRRAAEGVGAEVVVTTEKDAVKLAGALTLPIVRVAVEAAVVEAAFVPELLSRLGRAPS